MDGRPTSSNRSSSGCVFTNSLMFLSTIHSYTIAKWISVIVTPISGCTFGCRSDFHITASLQNLYTGFNQRINSERIVRPGYDPRQLSSVSPCMRMFLSPLLQHLDYSIPPSTRPQNRQSTTESPVGRSKEGSGAIWEGVCCDYTSCTQL